MRLKKKMTDSSLVAAKTPPSQPGFGYVFQQAGTQISKATQAIRLARHESHPHDLPVTSIVFTLVLLIILGTGKGLASQLCSEKDSETRIGRSLTNMEDGVFMVIGYLVLLLLIGFQGRHFVKNFSSARKIKTFPPNWAAAAGSPSPSS